MEDKKLGFAKRDVKKDECFEVKFNFKTGLLESDVINCFEGITLIDFMENKNTEAKKDD